VTARRHSTAQESREDVCIVGGVSASLGPTDRLWLNFHTDIMPLEPLHA